ncbi:MAG: aminotransferase class III-fold pyridoxal phosphate-dependent enzyme [Phycisphaerales bacterium]|nr:aminotransferase class III-fold pyridoxal phosphate-dependent enzyme [Phycisphaerales bacterium]
MTVPHSATEPLNLDQVAHQLLTDYWHMQGTVKRLPGENANFLVTSKSTQKHVLKITLDPSTDVRLEETVLETLRQADIPVPTTVPDANGQTIVKVSLTGQFLDARLQLFLPGTAWRTAAVGLTGLYNIGALLARAHEATTGITSSEAERSHRWDLANAQQHRDTVNLITDRHQRQVLEYCYQLHAGITQPLLARCPMGMLHGDPNDENILMDGDDVVGLIDASDCLYSQLIVDLGTCLAYALQQPNASLKNSASLIAGYQSIRQLTPCEQEVLFPLALTRLATSLCISAQRRQHQPEHTTWFSHDQTTWTALEAFSSISPSIATDLLTSTTPNDTATIDELTKRRDAHLSTTLSVSYKKPLHIVRGQQQFLISADGRPYLDMVNNVCHVGHCHPHVVASLTTQIETLNTNTRYLHEGIIQYTDRLCATLPDALDTCFLVNSGSEANELAIRLARTATKRNGVMVIDGAYHGNTGNCVAMSPYKFNGPGGSGQADWIQIAPSPDLYRGRYRGSPSEAAMAYAAELPALLENARQNGQPIAGFFAEPILSCGGQIPLPQGYLKAAFEHVRQAGGLCIADEVQVGFGRVGSHFWAFQQHDVIPDIVVMGKPIGNGHPMGAVVTTKEIAEAFNNGMEFFSTFGGNPVSCACGNAVLDVIEQELLQQNARTLGTHFLTGLREMQSRHPLIGDVRGHGLFLGIELVTDHNTREPAAAQATAIVNAMREHGVLLSTDGPLHNVIKIKPPMVVDISDINMTLRLLDDALSELSEGTTRE